VIRNTVCKIAAQLLAPIHFKGKARLLHTLCPKQGITITNLFGYQIELDLSDYIQRSMYLKVFEPHESRFVKNYLKPGMTFVDVGANVGHYTLMAAALVGPKGKVFAFEPSPYAYSQLAKTIKKNGLAQVFLIEAGLSDRPDRLQLYVPKAEVGNHNSTLIPVADFLPIEVSVERLDTYLTEQKINHVDLLKIDVEGFEPNVFRGAGSYITEGKIAAILCEFNQFWLQANQSSSRQLYQFLVQQGYRPKAKINFNADFQYAFFEYHVS
jgi:FkbM family methyltransferase